MHMCAPVPMVLTGVSTLMGITSANQQAKATEAMYNNQAAVAEQNARISAAKQNQINSQYLQEKQRLDDKMRLVAGQNRAAAGASGLAMSGSPLQALAASYDAYNQDVTTWNTNKNNAIWNEKVNEVNYLNQANAARSAASNIKSQVPSSMLATLIGGASSMYSLKSQYAKTPQYGTHGYTRYVNDGTITLTDAMNPNVYETNIKTVRFNKGKYNRPGWSVG